MAMLTLGVHVGGLVLLDRVPSLSQPWVIIPWFVAIFACGIVLVLTPGMFRKRMARRLGETGVQRWARVVRQSAPFEHSNFIAIHWLELEVSLPGGDAYVALHNDRVPKPLRRSLVGRQVVVRVDPNDPRCMLILWSLVEEG